MCMLCYAQVHAASLAARKGALLSEPDSAPAEPVTEHDVARAKLIGLAGNVRRRLAPGAAPTATVSDEPSLPGASADKAE